MDDNGNIIFKDDLKESLYQFLCDEKKGGVKDYAFRNDIIDKYK